MKQFEVGKQYKCSNGHAGDITITNRTRKYIDYEGSLGVPMRSRINESTLDGTEYIMIERGIWTYIYMANKEVK